MSATSPPNDDWRTISSSEKFAEKKDGVVPRVGSLDSRSFHGDFGDAVLLFEKAVPSLKLT